MTHPRLFGQDESLLFVFKSDSAPSLGPKRVFYESDKVFCCLAFLLLGPMIILKLNLLLNPKKILKIFCYVRFVVYYFVVCF